MMQHAVIEENMIALPFSPSLFQVFFYSIFRLVASSSSHLIFFFSFVVVPYQVLFWLTRPCQCCVCKCVNVCVKCEWTQGLGHGGFNTPLTLHMILFLSSLTSNTISKYRHLLRPSSSKNIPALLPLSLSHPFWLPGFMFYVVVVFFISHSNTNKKSKKTITKKNNP